MAQESSQAQRTRVSPEPTPSAQESSQAQRTLMAQEPTLAIQVISLGPTWPGGGNIYTVVPFLITPFGMIEFHMPSCSDTLGRPCTCARAEPPPLISAPPVASVRKVVS